MEGVEGAEGEPGADDGVMYVTREDGQVKSLAYSKHLISKASLKVAYSWGISVALSPSLSFTHRYV